MNPDAALARLRCTAALLNRTSSVAARFVHDDRTLLEVMRPPHPAREHLVLPVCWYRAFVLDACANGLPVDKWERSRFEGLLACRVELGTSHDAELLPGNVLRVVDDDAEAWIHLLAVDAPFDLVHDAAIEVASETDPEDENDAALRIGPDADLGVSVLSLATPQDEAGSEVAADVVRTVAMRAAIARLERSLGSIVDHPARGRSGHPPDGPTG